MNLQRREEISALLAAPVTGGAGQVLEYRDALMECRAHIDALEQTAAERVIRDGSRGPTPDYTGEGSAWVPPAVAPAVVVPEVPMGTALQRLGLRLTQILDGHEFAVLEHEFLNPAIEEMQKLSVLSDRALGEGMVQISGRELACMRAELEYRRAESDEAPDSVLDPLWDAFNALRANQGGANE